MPIPTPKPWYASRTAWAAIAAIAITVLEAVTAAVSGEHRGAVTGLIGDDGYQAVVLVLSLLTLVFRALARGPLTLGSPGSGLAVLLAGSLAVLLVGGCAGPMVDSPPLRVRNSAANTLHMTADDWSAVTQGREPTGVVVDDQGLEQLGGGPHMTTGLVAGDARLFTTSPTGLRIDAAVIDFEEGAVSRVSISGLASDPAVAIEAYTDQVVAALEAQGAITAEQAAVWRAAIDAGSATLADLLAALVRGGL